MRTLVGLGLLSIVIILGFCGCGPTNNNPPTFPVTGTVTFKGNPVEGADVIFVPSSPDALAAFGKTDAAGKYAMRTFEPSDGVVTGSYKVKVSKLEVGDLEETQQEFETAEEEAEAYIGLEYVPPPKNLLPKKFADHNSSGLTHSVATEPTVFDIKL